MDTVIRFYTGHIFHHNTEIGSTLRYTTREDAQADAEKLVENTGLVKRLGASHIYIETKYTEFNIYAKFVA